MKKNVRNLSILVLGIMFLISNTTNTFGFGLDPGPTPPRPPRPPTPPPDTIPPTVEITSHSNMDEVNESITISASASDNVEILNIGFNIGDRFIGSISEDSDSIDVDTTEFYNGIYQLKVTAVDTSGNYAQDIVNINIINIIPEKFAVFFWASNAATQEIIDEYWDVLQGEGYTKIFNFKDTFNFLVDFNTVNNWVGPEDTVFFYLYGHGKYDENKSDSCTYFAPDTSKVYSSEFRTMMDSLDTIRKAFLIESCCSGGFPEDFKTPPYLAMSTSDQTHLSFTLGEVPGEGIFSYEFFLHVNIGYNAVDSFYYAEKKVFEGAVSNVNDDDDANEYFKQYLVISNYSNYTWFG